MIRFGFILVEALYGKRSLVRLSETSLVCADPQVVACGGERYRNYPSYYDYYMMLNKTIAPVWVMKRVKVDHRTFDSGELFATGWDITTNLAAGRRSDKLWFRNSSVEAILNWIKSFTPITSLDPFRIVFDVVSVWCYIAQILVSDHWELNNTERKYAGSMFGYIALEIRTSVILHLVVISDQLIGGEAKFVKSEVG